MNRRKTESRTPATTFIAIIAAAAISAGGGVLHVFYKNRQIQVANETDELEQVIDQHRLDIRTVEMRMDELLNRFTMREQLASGGSLLEPMPMEVVEVMKPNDKPAATMATASNL